MYASTKIWNENKLGYPCRLKFKRNNKAWDPDICTIQFLIQLSSVSIVDRIAPIIVLDIEVPFSDDLRIGQVENRLGLFLGTVVVPLVPEHLAERDSGLEVFLGSCIRIKAVENLD